MDILNQLTDDERAAGFKLLFDGKTTQGWRGYKRTDMPPTWRVHEGALRFEPVPGKKFGDDIVTVDPFSRFELLIDWRLWQGGNSGILYHVQEIADKPWQTGPEIQLLDNVGHKDASVGTERQTGACYGLYGPAEDVTAPLGEWNHFRLIVDGKQVEHRLNGLLLCHYELGSSDWVARVAASKFAELPHFAKERKGHICLQDHVSPVEFRNIKIRAW